MVILLPVIVSVPVREFRLGLAVNEKVTVPLPVLLAPDVIVIQLRLSVAVRGQSPPLAVTPTLPFVAVAGNGVEEYDKVNAQPP